MNTDFYFAHLLNDYSGSPRVLGDLLNGLGGIASKTVITSQHDGFLKHSATTKLVTIPYHNSRYKLITLMLFAFAQLCTFLVLSALLIKGRLQGRGQLVISNTLLPFGANLAAKLFAHRLICYVHETNISPKPLQYMLTRIAGYCTDELIFVSNYVRDFHASWAEKKLSHVIYNAVSGAFMHPEQPSHAELQTKFKSQSVLFVGSLKHYKGIDTFISLAEALPQFQFTAVLNSDCREFSAFAAKQCELHNLTLLHRPSNLAQVYQQHALLVNLSKLKECTETFGLTLIEAMACATPVIAPNAGGPLEVVQNQSGYTIDVTDMDSLISHIEGLLHSQEKWMEMSIHAYAQSKHFSVDTYNEKISSVVFKK